MTEFHHSLSDAVDQLVALCGHELYQMLAIQVGWSPKHYEEWLFDVLAFAMFGESIPEIIVAD